MVSTIGHIRADLLEDRVQRVRSLSPCGLSPSLCPVTKIEWCVTFTGLGAIAEQILRVKYEKRSRFDEFVP